MNNYQFEVYETTHNKTLPTFGTFQKKRKANNVAKNLTLPGKNSKRNTKNSKKSGKKSHFQERDL